jgi:hypothetical protein
MSDPPEPPEHPREPEVESPALDPVQAAYLQQQLESDQNLGMALGAGALASLVGAAAWAGITVITGGQIGFMAIGVGFLVGYAVRIAGKGLTAVFGVVGAGFALVGCALGNLFAVTALVAQNEGVAFLEAVGQLNPEFIQDLMVAFFSPMDLLFYAIAIYEGYRLSFREVTAEDIDGTLSGGGRL